MRYDINIFQADSLCVAAGSGYRYVKSSISSKNVDLFLKYQGTSTSPLPLFTPSPMDPTCVDLLQNTTLSNSEDFIISLYEIFAIISTLYQYVINNLI
jgi:hypothetical protein